MENDDAPNFEDRPSAVLNEPERPGALVQLIVLSIILGGIGGVAAYWGYTIYLVSNKEFQQGSLSYGQPWAYIMTPLAAGLGALAGLNLMLTVTGRGIVGTVIGAIGGLLVGFTVRHLWNESLRQYGPDPSDAILYVPLMLGSEGVFYLAGLSMIVTLLLLYRSAQQRRDQQPLA